MNSEINLPDLTRVERARGEVHDDIRVSSAYDFLKFRPVPGLREVGVWGRERLMSKLFLNHYDISDAQYRRDFLDVLIVDRSFRKGFEQAFRRLPHKRAEYVGTRNGYYYPYSVSTIKGQAAVIRKYLEFPRTLEMLAELPPVSEAVRDLTDFARETRKGFQNYADFVVPLLEKPLIAVDGETVDVSWADHCLDEIGPYRQAIEEANRIRGQIVYYRILCAPFELTFDGKRIPSCKPEFIDPERRKGTIVNAYHPYYFTHGDEKGKVVVTALNTPNTVHWGDDARYTFVHGPNTMGKTVFLRTIGLNIHNAMAGLRCFAESCVMSPPDGLYPCFDMGDTLNTGHFETGADKIVYMRDNATRHSIVLLDETGGGTEPEAEREIQKGVYRALIEQGITFFAVTHDKGAWRGYREMNGSRILRVADLDDDENRHRVWEGEAEGGYGMKLAGEKGIDSESLRNAFTDRLGNPHPT